VPPAPSDRRLLVGAGLFVVLAAAAFAAALFFATGGGQSAPKRGPVYIGLERDLRNTLKQGPRLYFAHPFGGTGFWLDTENGHLVALVARRADDPSCTVAWRNLRRGYYDCHGHKLTGAELERYPLQFPQLGPEAGGVIVDFRHVDPPLAPLPARR
jgi:hypothetical protein